MRGDPQLFIYTRSTLNMRLTTKARVFGTHPQQPF